jgi:hypothetical protein
MGTQNIIATLIVLAAAAWLGKRIYGVLRSASGKREIGACGQCPKNPTTNKTTQIVEINQKPPADKP